MRCGHCWPFPSPTHSCRPQRELLMRCRWRATFSSNTRSGTRSVYLMFIPEVLPMARAAGFHNVELNTAFFAPEIRDRTLALIRTLGLRMPSIYVGGPMHSEMDARRTIDAALEHARLAAPLACKGLVHNPDPKPGGEPKSNDELAAQAEGLNRMGRALSSE